MGWFKFLAFVLVLHYYKIMLKHPSDVCAKMFPYGTVILLMKISKQLEVCQQELWLSPICVANTEVWGIWKQKQLVSEGACWDFFGFLVYTHSTEGLNWEVMRLTRNKWFSTNFRVFPCYTPLLRMAKHPGTWIFLHLIQGYLFIKTSRVTPGESKSNLMLVKGERALLPILPGNNLDILRSNVWWSFRCNKMPYLLSRHVSGRDTMISLNFCDHFHVNSDFFFKIHFLLGHITLAILCLPWEGTGKKTMLSFSGSWKREMGDLNQSSFHSYAHSVLSLKNQRLTSHWKEDTSCRFLTHCLLLLPPSLGTPCVRVTMHGATRQRSSGSDTEDFSQRGMV